MEEHSGMSLKISNSTVWQRVTIVQMTVGLNYVMARRSSSTSITTSGSRSRCTA